VNVLLSMFSEMTTCVAWLADTVSIDELPCVIALGAAAIATVGLAGGGVDTGLLLPQEVSVARRTGARETNTAEHRMADNFRMMARSNSPTNFRCFHSVCRQVR
jgi:hypothetical protein